MKQYSIAFVISRLTIAGDVLFIFWILFNGMDSGWQATGRQWAVYITLVLLLGLSGVLIYSYSNKQLKR